MKWPSGRLPSVTNDGCFQHAGGDCERIVVLLSNEKQVKFRARETINERVHDRNASAEDSIVGIGYHS
jgi:hypothetical protein